MNILVTGSRGYIGGRLCELLEQHAQHTVRRGTRHVEYEGEMQMDWSSISTLETACEGVDAIVHLAALNATRCIADPALALEVNGAHTARLLQAAQRRRVKRFIYLSTAHVYGSMQGRLDEGSPLQSTHPYATSHRVAEDAAMTIAADKNMFCIILRLSNAFGRPARPDADCWSLLMNDLCRQATASGIMRLRSNGMQRRDFITMSDTCRAVLHVLEMSPPEHGNAIYNLGGGWSPTVLEAAQLIAQRYHALFGMEPELVRTVTAGEPDSPLDYDCSKLTRTGFITSNHRTQELDALLSYCHTHFLHTRNENP